MAEKPSAMTIDLSDYEALKKLEQTTSCGNFTVLYDPKDTAFISIKNKKAKNLRKKTQRAGGRFTYPLITRIWHRDGKFLQT